ncbi:MAG: PAS domain-containing sensor histidine kinase [Promethearchaeota archaeon]
MIDIKIDQLNLLLLNKNQEYFSLIENSLKEDKSIRIKLDFLQDLSEALNFIENNQIDLILLDINFINGNFNESIKNLLQKTPDIPIIIITPKDKEELAKEIIEKGAQDYIIEEKINGFILIRVIKYTLEKLAMQIQLKQFKDKLNKLNEILIQTNKKNSIEFTESEDYFKGIIDRIEQKLKKSEEKYHTLLETSVMGLFEIDINSKAITYINPKLLEIIGYNKDEIGKKNFLYDIVDSEGLDKIIGESNKKDVEYRIKTKKGAIKWLAGRKIYDYDEKGNPSKIRLWVYDITEQKIYEKLIFELNVNFLNFTTGFRKNIELLLNTCRKLLNAEVVLYIFRNLEVDDKDFHIITSNNEFFTYREKDFRKKIFISELFTQTHYLPQFFHDIDKMSLSLNDEILNKYNPKSGYGKLIESINNINSGICALFQNTPKITLQDQFVLYSISDAIEIEQRRWQAQLQIEKQNKMLNEINRMKTELIRRTSHELKTPLIAIKGFTDLLLKMYNSELNSSLISILEEIKNGSIRLEKIINSLLESSRYEKGHVELRIKENNLTSLIKSCINELKGLAELKNLIIRFEIKEEIKLKFDKDRIRNVFSNLLLNAIKFTPPNGKININVEKKNEYYIVSVKDNGIGLLKNEKDKIFKQFGKIERYGKGWDINIEGYGLGLYISKKIIELHGGEIWVESQGRNKGSTFYFKLPINKK